jgi:hypothetical protein
VNPDPVIADAIRDRLQPEFDSWEAHGGVWSASRLRQNEYLRVRELNTSPIIRSSRFSRSSSASPTPGCAIWLAATPNQSQISLS